MNRAWSFLFLAACASSRRADSPSLPPAQKPTDPQILALFNGEPITRAEVADKILELERKRCIDTYLRWKVLESTRTRLGIVHTPEELERRADSMIGQYKKTHGEEAFRKQLELEGLSEETYRASVRKNRLFNEKLTLEKMIRYSYFAEGWMEIDRVMFAEEEDARRFETAAREKGYDAAIEAEKPPQGRMARRPREVFLRDLPPPDLDPETVTKLFGMKAGECTGIERGPGGVFGIVLIRKRLLPVPEPYEALRTRIFDWILEDPPSDAELAGWIDLQLKRSKIEYADRDPQGN